MNKRKHQPLCINSEQLGRLIVMASQSYGRRNVEILRKDGIIDEYVSINITNNKLTSLYHWFEFASVHLPKMRYKGSRLDYFNKTVLTLTEDRVHIIDYLWNLKP